jgi:hypothetical protein
MDVRVSPARLKKIPVIQPADFGKYKSISEKNQRHPEQLGQIPL